MMEIQSTHGKSLVEMLEAKFDAVRMDAPDLDADLYDGGFYDGLSQGLAIAIATIREPYVDPPRIDIVWEASREREALL
jgi:hypothetical protein